MSASWDWPPSSVKSYMLTFHHCHFGALSQSYEGYESLREMQDLDAI